MLGTCVRPAKMVTGPALRAVLAPFRQKPAAFLISIRQLVVTLLLAARKCPGRIVRKSNWNSGSGEPQYNCVLREAVATVGDYRVPLA